MKNRLKSEHGITVIALIISIIIIVTLSAAALRGITGQEGVVERTIESSEKYLETLNKENIIEALETIVRKYNIAGDDINLSTIATQMNNEDWIKSAVVGNDLIVTTDNGYVFDVYYSEEYGQRFIEYLGREDENAIPSIEAVYNKQTQTITVSSSEAQNIELSYGGEVVRTTNGTSLSYIANKTGWYVAKAISSNGKVRYAWIRTAVENLSAKLEITSVGMLDNGWYGKDSVPVQVKISTNGSKIYYKLGTEGEYTEVVENNTTVSINTLGKTTVYAYAEDGSGNESEVSSLKVRYDNTKPTIGEIVLTGDVRDSGIYKSDVIISLDNATDTGSGLDGYYWWIVDENASNETFVKGIDKTITVSSEGTKKIGLQLKDKAGNLSDIQTVTVTKEKFSVGDYVSYTPTTGTYDLITNSSTYAGTADNTNDFTTETFNWRIWSTDGDTLTLIADGVTSTGGTSNNGTLSLYGAVGYNNGVKILNDICENCYSNASLGAKGRSISIEDIENVLDRGVWKPEDYGMIPLGKEEYYYTYGNSIRKTGVNRNYPYIYQFEEYSTIMNDGSLIKFEKGEGLNRSKQEEYYNGTQYTYLTADTYLEPVLTAWEKELSNDNFTNSIYYNELQCGSNWAWIASRSVWFAQSYSPAYFGLQSFYNGSITKTNQYNTYKDSVKGKYCVCPMVEIDLSVANLGQVGLGTLASPYSLEAR